MLNTVLKVTGIISIVAVLMAVLFLYLLNFNNPKSMSHSKEAKAKASMKVIKAETSGSRIIFLLNVKNGSDQMLFLHGLVVSVLNENNDVIDKCRVLTSDTVPRSIIANEENVVKVICNDMQFATNQKENVSYSLNFEERF